MKKVEVTFESNGSAIVNWAIVDYDTPLRYRSSELECWNYGIVGEIKSLTLDKYEIHTMSWNRIVKIKHIDDDIKRSFNVELTIKGVGSKDDFDLEWFKYVIDRELASTGYKYESLVWESK